MSELKQRPFCWSPSLVLQDWTGDLYTIHPVFTTLPISGSELCGYPAHDELSHHIIYLKLDCGLTPDLKLASHQATPQLQQQAEHHGKKKPCPVTSSSPLAFCGSSCRV